MYGLLVESIIEIVKTKFGSHVWDQIRTKTRLDNDNVTTHQQYSEALIQKIVKTLSEITGEYELFGAFYTNQYLVCFAHRPRHQYSNGYAWHGICKLYSKVWLR
jgi:hypothetical protein